MQQDELLDRCLEKMKAAGFDRVQLELNESEKHELNQQHSEINLLRTGFNTSLQIVGIRDSRRASLGLNKLDDESLDQAILDLSDMADGSPQDEAYDIAPKQGQQAFTLGATAANAELMYDRLATFIEYTRSNHPTTIVEEAAIDFTLNKSRIVNSQGVNFSVNQGVYNAYAMFTSKSGTDTSSFNYSGFSSTTLDKELQDEAHLAELLRQSEEQVKTRQIAEKFHGDLVITPHAMDDFIGFLSSNISDGQMIAGTSIYKDAINTAVTSPLIT
ncbi:MAG: TldD/PmbA family protein, partial [Gammaproteobacteria bacterium]|nr:TldD/PmbA family protein [Gammaproteobacteria bacterium]